MLTFSLNWLAVLVALIANMVVGALWFGPLFGKQWMKELGLTMEDIEGSDMVKPYGIAILNSFLMAFILANVIHWTGTSTLFGGVLLGLLMWVGFSGFSFAANHAFEGRSAPLWFYNSFGFLFGLIIQGAILGIWQ
jgi:hypothetical protein